MALDFILVRRSIPRLNLIGWWVAEATPPDYSNAFALIELAEASIGETIP